MRRLKANMLSNHPFIKGLLEDDIHAVDQSEEDVLNMNDITSSTSFSYDDSDSNSNDEFWRSSYSNGSSRMKGMLMPWKFGKTHMPDFV